LHNKQGINEKGHPLKGPFSGICPAFAISIVKRLGFGIEGALKQAKSCLRNLGINRDILIFDGICYQLYSHTDDFRPTCYANLANTKESVIELRKTESKMTGSLSCQERMMVIGLKRSINLFG
jgi:hypothetical protein